MNKIAKSVSDKLNFEAAIKELGEETADVTSSPTKFFEFMLIPEFSVLSLSTATETLHNYNLHVGRQAYKWILTSISDKVVASSSGIAFPTEMRKKNDTKADVFVLVGGANIDKYCDPKLLGQLRWLARQGVQILGLCTAAYPMVAAELMNSRPVAIHWRYHQSLEENFHDVELTKSAYHLDQKFGTSAGGVSAIDLFLAIIEIDHGLSSSDAVAELMNYRSIRTLNANMDLSLPIRMNVGVPKLARVLQIMEENIEEPITSEDLAHAVSISTRQLQRLFHKHIGLAPTLFYTSIRLEVARRLLIQTTMSITEISFATGFSSPSIFSKNYKKKFNSRPSQIRQGIRKS